MGALEHSCHRDDCQFYSHKLIKISVQPILHKSYSNIQKAQWVCIYTTELSWAVGAYFQMDSQRY